MKKWGIGLLVIGLLVVLPLAGCQQPRGACVIDLGCMDDETEAKCDRYVDGEFYEGLSCVDLGFDAAQSLTRGILEP